MSIILIDSMDHYDTAHAYVKWTGTPSIVAGRTGNGVLGSATYAKKTFTKGTTFAVGAARYPWGGTIPGEIFRFDISTNARAYLALSSDGRLTINYSYNWNSLAWTSYTHPTPVITTVNWMYFELWIYHWMIPDPNGSSGIDVVVRLNEEVLFTTSLAQSEPSAEEGFTSVTFVNGIFDDLYVTDDEFLGDIRIYVIKPNGDSTPSSWIPSTPGPHYQMVDEVNPDEDTTYLYSDTVGQQDMVTLEDINLVGEIKGVQGNFIAKKDEAGSAAYRREYVISGSSYEVATDVYLSYLAYVDHYHPMRVNPITGLDFTNDEINAMIMGVKRTI